MALGVALTPQKRSPLPYLSRRRGKLPIKKAILRRVKFSCIPSQHCRNIVNTPSIGNLMMVERAPVERGARMPGLVMAMATPEDGLLDFYLTLEVKANASANASKLGQGTKLRTAVTPGTANRTPRAAEEVEARGMCSPALTSPARRA